MLINKIQEYCIHLFQKNHLVVYQKFFQQILLFQKIFNSEIQSIEVFFTDQNSKPLEVKYRINLTLVIK